MRAWDHFAKLLPQVAAARYRIPGQVPEAPDGVQLPPAYVGRDWTNCNVFTAWLCAMGMGAAYRGDQWDRWQVVRYDDRGYGPGVLVEQGLAYPVVEPQPLHRGVYLLQSFYQVPRPDDWHTLVGHSRLVIASHGEGLDAPLLTLEANTATTGLDGVGFLGLGPIRSTDARRWWERTTVTSRSLLAAPRLYAARLYVDPTTVQAWLDLQQEPQP